MLQNKQIDCSVHGLNFNIHTKAHMARAAQEGIVFAFKYGMDIMNEMGIDIQVIRAGNANLFLSPIFRDALAGVTGTVIDVQVFTRDGVKRDKRAESIIADALKRYRRDLDDQLRIVERDSFDRLRRQLAGHKVVSTMKFGAGVRPLRSPYGRRSRAALHRPHEAGYRAYPRR
jgi:hypothetical protein